MKRTAIFGGIIVCLIMYFIFTNPYYRNKVNTYLLKNSPDTKDLSYTVPLSPVSQKENLQKVDTKKIPAFVKSYSSKNGIYTFVLDYFEFNPCFTPGGPKIPGCVTQDFFINKVPENIELPVNKNVKVYYCFIDGGPNNVDLGPDNDPTNPDSEVPFDTLLKRLEDYSLPQTYYFLIENSEIFGIYQQCLP